MCFGKKKKKKKEKEIVLVEFLALLRSDVGGFPRKTQLQNQW